MYYPRGYGMLTNETRLPRGDQWKAEKLGAFWRWPITRCLIKSVSAGLFIEHSKSLRLNGEHWRAVQFMCVTISFNCFPDISSQPSLIAQCKTIGVQLYMYVLLHGYLIFAWYLQAMQVWQHNVKVSAQKEITSQTNHLVQCVFDLWVLSCLQIFARQPSLTTISKTVLVLFICDITSRSILPDICQSAKFDSTM